MARLGMQPRQHPGRLGKHQIRDRQLVERLQPAIGLNGVGALEPGHVVVDLTIAVAIRRPHPPELGAVAADDEGHRGLPPRLERRVNRGRHDPPVDQRQVAVGEDRRRRQEQIGRGRTQIRRRSQSRAIGPDLAALPR